MQLEKYNFNNLLFFIFLYLTLVAGFAFDERLNYGTIYDNVINKHVINQFSINFKETLLYYDQHGHRHSPVYLIFLSFFLDLGLNYDSLRFIHLHLCLSLILVFYNCLKLVFNNIKVHSLQLLSLSIFLSPTFRSLSIWPDSRLPGLIFFIVSIYFFLKFFRNHQLKYAWFSSIALILSSYISPNFSIFAIYFYYYFAKEIKIKSLVPLIIFNILVSIPVFYYLFVLKINFLSSGKTVGIDGGLLGISYNFADKIMIIGSIILFHLLPILLSINLNKDFLGFFKKYLLKSIIIFLPLIYFFNYQVEFTGGGFFFQLSQLLFNNNYLFFGISFISFYFLLYFSKLSLNNFFLIILIIISNIQNTIYHKYYDPMILIIFFTLFNKLNLELFFEKKRGLIYLYTFGLGYIFLRVFKDYAFGYMSNFYN